MSKFTRRQLLIFFGSSAGAAVLAPTLGQRGFGLNPSFAQSAEPLKFTPVRLPHPLPIYQQQASYLPTAINKGKTLEPSEDTRLERYTVLDDVVVPPEYERYVIVRWGDRVFADSEEYVGYNNDFTGFIPINDSTNDGYLWINHEYNSYPLTRFAPEAPDDLEEFEETFPIVVGFEPTARGRTLLGEFLYNMGGSILRITRDNSNGRFAVVRDPLNRRIHTLSGLGINRDRSDEYRDVTSWGDDSYQQGDENYLIGTGPAAQQVFEQVNADGLGNRIIGTGHNCSGGVSPWGTILTAEENFQASSAFFVGVTEAVRPNGTQTQYTNGTTGDEFGQVGEKYGWITEIDPADPSFRPRKHTALGRFRWENIALRAESGNRLVTYMGDDRRGGHTWKFVSAGTVNSPNDKANSGLFEEGTLYVARYNADGTGQWLPLYLDAQTNPISPTELASGEAAARGGAITAGGLIRLPLRNGIAGQTTDGGLFSVTTANEATALPGYQGKKLSDFYTSQGAVLVDAFPAANLIGGTPTARPEDLEVHPRTKEVFIAYTDGAPGSDGYPDSRIFIVSKYSTAVTAIQPSGSLFKIIEDSSDGAGNTFRWQRFAKGGEAGQDRISDDIRSGFANVDNLVFDSAENVWGVTDMSTEAHNGFGLGPNAVPANIDHTVVGAVVAGATSDLNTQTSSLVGVFGNNWLFFIPTTGEDAGEIFPFAYGPVRCEMTGPTFVGDTLIISVQHPGENCPFTPQVQLNRDIEMLNLDGTLFNQNRTVPRGSNWPSNIEGNLEGPPRPSVIGIRRKEPLDGRFV